MRKLISLIITFVICITATGIVFYRLGFENAKKETEMIIVNEADMDESIGKTDYPLIDIAFNDGSEWSVLITYGIYSEKMTYLLCDDGKELQFDKEYLSVTTYPAGRGTTGVGSITVYQNGKEVKHLEFFDIVFKKEGLKAKFEEISQKELDEFMQNK